MSKIQKYAFLSNKAFPVPEYKLQEFIYHYPLIPHFSGITLYAIPFSLNSQRVGISQY
ncbi:MAG: hypothetical protein JETT_0524 [Candidatus Jettenia ecosi]|uniref:Uncharacterized protein n=1 Tax=Candidatus Jettenia ecosi TaxID=2494326 RepID=A0A533QER6_9BACT|nr:MAG: hypothetical protein JETT_0524 [Candidatus Jettenia ecosi]